MMGSLLESTRNTRTILRNSYRYIRSDVPDKLDEQEILWLLDHAVTTIIDLREEAERQRRKCPLEHDKRFRYLRMPVTGGSQIPESMEAVPVSYINMADSQMEKIMDTIENAESNVLYFCNAGKDRTGVVSAILLSRLGMEREYIIADYMKSKDNLQEALNGFVENDPSVDIRIITPQETYMEIFLDWLKDR